MSHLVLSTQQFGKSDQDMPVEKSLTSPDPENIIPEKEDEDVGQKPN